MALDALYVSALARELDSRLNGVRVDKIYQPDKDGFRFHLRNGDKLIIDAGNNYPRVHLTRENAENPSVPPMFCMLLRKHLAGGRISSVRAQELERAMDITFDVNDEMGVATRRTLVLEMMGRHSNLILCDADMRIIDCLKRIDLSMSEKRQVLPGLFYHTPPKQDKKSPFELAADDFRYANTDTTVSRYLLDRYMGVSPLVWREILHRAGVNDDLSVSDLTDSEIASIVKSADEVFNENIPYIIYEGEKPKDFCFCRIHQYGDLYTGKDYESLSETLDTFYKTRTFRERMRQKSINMLRTVENLRQRAERKVETQKKELTDALDRERDRRMADIITANLYRMERGMNVLYAQDFYEEGAPEIEIKLDIRLSPQQNAAKLYKNYNRKKNAEKILSEQIEKSLAESEYLETVVQAITQAETERELEEIREELRDGGYLARQGGGKGKSKKTETEPRVFTSVDGYTILVGRNNRQNDMLTLKYAYKSDIWFHTQKIPGSHVIVRTNGQTPPDSTLTQAAELAAYYSRARESSQVPVDYTQVRNVKKPSGAKPGKVIYVDYLTAYVTPKNIKE